jgi:hypothetical protein
MSTIPELRAVLLAAAHELETAAVRLQGTSENVHAERNVLLVTLGKTAHEDMRASLGKLGEIYDDLEDKANALKVVADWIRRYAESL